DREWTNQDSGPTGPRRHARGSARASVLVQRMPQIKVNSRDGDHAHSRWPIPEVGDIAALISRIGARPQRPEFAAVCAADTPRMPGMPPRRPTTAGLVPPHL